jgi:hypothetical protein
VTTSELIAGKTFALSVAVVAGITTVLADTPGIQSRPLEWGAALTIVGAAVGYGSMRGALRERQRSDEKRFRRVTRSMEYLEACVTRVAEKLNIPLSDLQADFQSDED